jgi:hypothetical protein
VVIDAGFDREDHNSIPSNCDQDGLEPLDAKTDSRIRLDGPMDQI